MCFVANVFISLAHHQRSSECTFFALSAPPKQRSGRPKKGRASKASRTSTQSILTSVSDGGSIIETEINEASFITMPAVESEHSTEIIRGKKGGKPRRAPTKAKAKASDTMLHESTKSSAYIEPEDEEVEVKIKKAPARKDHKRKSDEMEDGSVHGSVQPISDADMNPPPAKRRTTRASHSIVAMEKTSENPLIKSHEFEMEVDDVQQSASAYIPTIKKGSQKGAKRGRKGTSSTVRKASAATIPPRISSGDTVPSDDALDAALEADLDRPLTDNEVEIEQSDIVYPKMRRLTRTRPGSRDGPPSLALERRTMRMSSPPLEGSSLAEQDSRSQVASRSIMGATRSASRLAKDIVLQNGLPTDISAGNADDALSQPKTKPIKPRKPAKSRVASRQLSKIDAQSLIPTPAPDNASSSDNLVTLGHVSQAGEDESGNETDVSGATKSLVKRGGEKGKQGKNAILSSPKPKKITRREVEKILSQPESVHVATAIDPLKNVTATIPSRDDQLTSLSNEEDVQLAGTTSKSKRFLERPLSDKSVGESEAQTPTQSPNAVRRVDQAPNTPHLSGSEREGTPSQAFPVVGNPVCGPSVQTTPRPAASPQSSDVENQPPSARPSSIRPPLLVPSPPKSQTIRIPLVTTPSTSPSKRNICRLQSTMPWSAIDYDKIFLGSPAEKENNPFNLKVGSNGEISGLISPEKKLSLEEWIQLNAQRGEEHLRSECERVIGKFEGEGLRALKTLEGIICVE